MNSFLPGLFCSKQFADAVLAATRRYDYNANKDGLKEVSLEGDLIEAASDDDVAVGYKVTRHVASKQNDLKLTASTHGTTVYGEYADNQLTEVGAQREVEIGDQK